MTSPPAKIRLDHLAIAATSLGAGARHVEERLGVLLAPGGRHDAMGTHNRLLSLGPDLYLEVIAVDPEAPAPARSRWFGLDGFSGPPRLQAWIVAVDDITTAPDLAGEPMSLSRGDLCWQMAVPVEGALPYAGTYPAFIAWESGGHPTARLEDRGVRLLSLEVTHPKVDELRAALTGLSDPRVSFSKGAPGLSAHLLTPQGEVTL